MTHVIGNVDLDGSGTPRPIRVPVIIQRLRIGETVLGRRTANALAQEVTPVKGTTMGTNVVINRKPKDVIQEAKIVGIVQEAKIVVIVPEVRVVGQVV